MTVASMALLSQTVRPELKLGVVTAIIGAPFLFSLIYRMREEGD